MIVEEALLATKLEELERLLPASGNLRGLLESFLRAAADDELVRINPVAFAQSHGCDEAALIELFLHGRKVGLQRMEWHYVCPGCGDIVESFESLSSATAHFFCQVCSADRDADLSDFIEITFSVSKEIRESRYHDPWSLSPECAFVEPGETVTFEATPGPEYLWFTNGPALIAGDDRTDKIRRFAFEYVGTRSEGYREEIAAGPVVVDFSNATEERYALGVINLPGEYEVTMKPFLSGAQLLSNQTFLDLFESETIVAASEANEIHLTDELLSTPGAKELLAAFATEARSVRFKGVHGDVRLHRVRPRVPAAT